jgi:hypothetical protein
VFFLTSVHNQEQMLVRIRNTNYFACSKFANILCLIFTVDITRVSMHLIHTVFIFYYLLFMYNSIDPARSNNLWDVELTINQYVEHLKWTWMSPWQKNKTNTMGVFTLACQVDCYHCLGLLWL